MHQALLQYEHGDKIDELSEEAKLAQKTVENMKSKLGYDDYSAKEVIQFLMKRRY